MLHIKFLAYFYHFMTQYCYSKRSKPYEIFKSAGTGAKRKCQTRPLLLHAASLDNRCRLHFHPENSYEKHKFLNGVPDFCCTRYLTPLINHDFSMPCLITAQHPAYMPLFKCFRQIALLYKEQEFGYELALKSLLLQSVFLLLPYSDRTPSAGSNPSSDKLKIVLDYVSIHYADTILVSDLAGLCYFSEYHFMRFFKNICI